MSETPNKKPDDQLSNKPTHDLGVLGDVEFFYDGGFYPEDEHVVTIRLTSRDSDKSVDFELTHEAILLLIRTAQTAHSKYTTAWLE